MANPKHLKILKDGPKVWNRWRQRNRQTRPDLSGARLALYRFEEADLAGANLRAADIRDAKLAGANLRKADLRDADMRRSNLRGANLRQANLSAADGRRANLSKANLQKANLREANLLRAKLSTANLAGARLGQANLLRANLAKANLSQADLRQVNLLRAKLGGTDLSGADLRQANLGQADLAGARLSGAQVAGVSAWNVALKGALQTDLVIASEGRRAITVDDLETAQYISLLLENSRLRRLTDPAAANLAIVFVRFQAERRSVLDAMRAELQKRGYLPIWYHFRKTAAEEIAETVATLVSWARFVIADLTDAVSLPPELTACVPHLPTVPVQPILPGADDKGEMLAHLEQYSWVLKPFRYGDVEELLASLSAMVIDPVEASAKKLQPVRADRGQPVAERSSGGLSEASAAAGADGRGDSGVGD